MSLNKQPQSVQAMHGANPQPHDGSVTVTPLKPGKLLRLPAVEERTGLKKSTIYAGVQAKTFPCPVRLSARAVAFREEDIDRWISGRVNTGGAA